MTVEPAEREAVLTAEQLRRTGQFIASHQDADGAIAWFRGGRLDPWDHVESAMALTVLGLYAEAEAAFEHSARTQAPDGSWPMERVDGEVRNASSDSNQCAYLAAGLYHHHLVTGRVDLLERLWPTTRAALDFVVGLQQPSGAIAWAVDERRRVDATALVTGSASILHSLVCGSRIAQIIGVPQPHWADAAARLATALARRPEAFADRGRYAMDWYYPVLGGALRGAAGLTAIDGQWDAFAWPGFGSRCVADRPWVTAAESAELVMSLDVLGRDEQAHAVLRDLQHLRDAESGGYWTGFVVPDDAIWPVEQTTWTAAAVVLAVDALAGLTDGSGVFRDVEPKAHR